VYIYIYIYVRISTYHAFFSLLFYVLQAKPELISIYHPIAEEVSTAMGTSMKGFFDGADVVATSTTPADAQGVPTETPILSAEPGPIEEGAQSEPASIPTETPTPQKGVTPPATSQTEIASPATPLVISTNDPFAALSQAVKDGSSLMPLVDLMQTCLLKRDLRKFVRILMMSLP